MEMPKDRAAILDQLETERRFPVSSPARRSPRQRQASRRRWRQQRAGASGNLRCCFSGGLARPAVVMEPDPKGGYVLSSLAEVVERILGFLPTKALLRAAW